MKRHIKNLYCLAVTLGVLTTVGFYGANRTSAFNQIQNSTPIVYSHMM
jgi:hypothetical protein